MPASWHGRRIMHRMNSVPIDIGLGVINGRDSIYLNTIEFSNRTNHLHISGEINGDLCSKPSAEKWIPYEIKFEWIIANKITELDTWESQQNWYNTSSFDLIENSEWLEKLGGQKLHNDHKHIIILTYDDVIELVCKSYQVNLGKPHA